MNNPSPLIALCAGEASGDLLGAHLVRAIRERCPEARFTGIGGPRMAAEGFESLFDQEKLAVRGYAEVLKKLPEILRIRRGLAEELKQRRPDVFVGIDAPDFNLWVAEQLKATGRVQRGQLGVMIQEVSYNLAKSFGLDKPTGALISKVMPDSPAAKAGLQVGDIVRSVNGEEVRASSDLPVMVGAIAPGKEVRLGVWRKGEEISVKVQLGSVGASVETGSSGSSNPAKQPDAAGFTVENTGLTLQVQNSDNKQHLIVTRVTGAAERAGLKRGDEILAVSQITVDDESTFRSALENAGKNVPLLVQRDGNTLFLALNLH